MGMWMAEMTAKKMSIEEKLMKYALIKGVDLWLFKEVFTDLRNDYGKYCELWREITRTKLDNYEFEDLQKLMKEYTKK